MYDVLVRGGTVVTEAATGPLDLAIAGERIAALGPPGTLGEAARVVDAEGCLVLPGGVDPHVHYGLGFGAVRAEGAEWSRAAALGGTTTVIDFALQEAPASLHEAVAAKRAESERLMAVDWSLHAIVAGPEVAPEVVEEVGDVVRGGIPTIKTFMTYGWMTDDGQRLALMAATADAGGMSVVHAEDDAIAVRLTERYVREGKTHGAYIAETRGPLVEEAAVRRAMLLAERTGSPLYVLHMGAGSAVRALAEGRARGLPFHGETLLLYLSFTAEKLWDDAGRGLLWNNYPPIKFQEDQDELWRALADGRLGAVGTDHFALTAADRYERMGTTVDSLQAGVASVELRVPVLYHLGVAGGRLSLERFVELVATGPARLMGLHPRKGVLAVGSDADVVVLDPRRSWTVRAEELTSCADYSCWDGWELSARVRTTLLRGAVVVENGSFVGALDGGRFLPRTLDPAQLASSARSDSTAPTSRG
jgi:dihydropyrimidinase